MAFRILSRVKYPRPQSEHQESLTHRDEFHSCWEIEILQVEPHKNR